VSAAECRNNFTAFVADQKPLLLPLVLLQFGRLERVEVGGTKGKALTNAIKQVHADFLVAHGKFQEVSYKASLQLWHGKSIDPEVCNSLFLRCTPGLMHDIPAAE
jgi:hypothetical protein